MSLAGAALSSLRMNGYDLGEYIQRQPQAAIQVEPTGTYLSPAGFRWRGISAPLAHITWDDLPVYDLDTGDFELHKLPMDHLSEVRIVRGGGGRAGGLASLELSSAEISSGTPTRVHFERGFYGRQDFSVFGGKAVPEGGVLGSFSRQESNRGYRDNSAGGAHSFWAKTWADLGGKPGPEGKKTGHTRLMFQGFSRTSSVGLPGPVLIPQEQWKGKADRAATLDHRRSDRDFLARFSVRTYTGGQPSQEKEWWDEKERRWHEIMSRPVFTEISAFGQWGREFNLTTGLARRNRRLGIRLRTKGPGSFLPFIQLVPQKLPPITGEFGFGVEGHNYRRKPDAGVAVSTLTAIQFSLWSRQTVFLEPASLSLFGRLEVHNREIQRPGETRQDLPDLFLGEAGAEAEKTTGAFRPGIRFAWTMRPPALEEARVSTAGRAENWFSPEIWTRWRAGPWELGLEAAAALGQILPGAGSLTSRARSFSFTTSAGWIPSRRFRLRLVDQLLLADQKIADRWRRAPFAPRQTIGLEVEGRSGFGLTALLWGNYRTAMYEGAGQTGARLPGRVFLGIRLDQDVFGATAFLEVINPIDQHFADFASGGAFPLPGGHPALPVRFGITAPFSS